ncbi:MAG: pyridoxal kinase PdxY [Acetobacteraceae bacterium]|nr:pyridoxal kinase PdxY [Acetobacteraceae bacterium]
MNILSIQSWVAYGHVGNGSAVFPLQRLGAEVWAIHTVQFSNHTGYGSWTGQVHSAETIRALVDGIEARGALHRCDAVLSGYWGAEDIGLAILDTVTRVRRCNSRSLYCCDPVMGDAGPGLFVHPSIPALLQNQAVPRADILTPNQFELELLTSRPCPSLAAAKQAARELARRMHQAGPRSILITSLDTQETPAESIDLLAKEGDEFHLLRLPRLPMRPNGAGDALAALYLFHRLNTGSSRAALEAAGSSLHGLLRRTLASGEGELAIIAAQDEFVAASVPFTAQPC